MARPVGSTSSARLRILSCASDLFYHKGINHVGINEIIDTSGVAKMTLYHHFKSKQDIIAAVLDVRRAQRLEGIQTAMARARTPRNQVLAAFGYLAEIIKDPAFRGCAFINATVELAEPEHPASLLSAQHKKSMIDEFERVAVQAGWRHPRRFALQCQLLWDGAIAAAQVNYDTTPVTTASSAVETLITAAQAESLKDGSSS